MWPTMMKEEEGEEAAKRTSKETRQPRFEARSFPGMSPFLVPINGCVVLCYTVCTGVPCISRWRDPIFLRARPRRGRQTFSSFAAQIDTKTGYVGL